MTWQQPSSLSSLSSNHSVITSHHHQLSTQQHQLPSPRAMSSALRRTSKSLHDRPPLSRVATDHSLLAINGSAFLGVSSPDRPLLPVRPVLSRRCYHSSVVKRKPLHIKKPLNAFMLFMKEMRSKVVDECTLKESAAINQILGRKVSITYCHNY